MSNLSATPSPALYEAICDGYRTFGLGQHESVAKSLGLPEEIVEHAWNYGWAALLGGQYGSVAELLAYEKIQILAEMETLRQAQEAEVADTRLRATRHIARTREHELGMSARFRKVVEKQLEGIERINKHSGPLFALVTRQVEQGVADAANGTGPFRDVHASIKALQDMAKLSAASVTTARAAMELERLRLNGLPDEVKDRNDMTTEEALATVTTANDIAAAAMTAAAMSLDDLREYGTLPLERPEDEEDFGA